MLTKYVLFLLASFPHLLLANPTAAKPPCTTSTFTAKFNLPTNAPPYNGYGGVDFTLDYYDQDYMEVTTNSYTNTYITPHSGRKLLRVYSYHPMTLSNANSAENLLFDGFWFACTAFSGFYAPVEDWLPANCTVRVTGTDVAGMVVGVEEFGYTVPGTWEYPHRASMGEAVVGMEAETFLFEIVGVEEGDDWRLFFDDLVWERAGKGC